MEEGIHGVGVWVSMNTIALRSVSLLVCVADLVGVGSWTAAVGDNPAGDSDLHAYYGQILFKGISHLPINTDETSQAANSLIPVHTPARARACLRHPQRTTCTSPRCI